MYLHDDTPQDILHLIYKMLEWSVFQNLKCANSKGQGSQGSQGSKD